MDFVNINRQIAIKKQINKDEQIKKKESDIKEDILERKQNLYQSTKYFEGEVNQLQSFMKQATDSQGNQELKIQSYKDQIDQVIKKMVDDSQKRTNTISNKQILKSDAFAQNLLNQKQDEQLKIQQEEKLVVSAQKKGETLQKKKSKKVNINTENVKSKVINNFNGIIKQSDTIFKDSVKMRGISFDNYEFEQFYMKTCMNEMIITDSCVNSSNLYQLKETDKQKLIKENSNEENVDLVQIIENYKSLIIKDYKKQKKQYKDILQQYQEEEYKDLIKNVINNDFDELFDLKTKSDMQDDKEIEENNLMTVEQQQYENDQDSDDLLEQVTNHQKKTQQMQTSFASYASLQNLQVCNKLTKEQITKHMDIIIEMFENKEMKTVKQKSKLKSHINQLFENNQNINRFEINEDFVKQIIFSFLRQYKSVSSSQNRKQNKKH